MAESFNLGVLGNSYTQLPEHFFEHVKPKKALNPELIIFNHELAEELSMSHSHLSKQDIAQIFSGNVLPKNSKPIAMAYAGHQFGQFVGQLGDGRAITLGDVKDQQGKLYNIQLKGAGKTMFSRNGDGLAPLGSVIREYIVSEAMHALGIPTTRALACVTTGERVWRQAQSQGAVLTRVANGLMRVGTFEYFAVRNDIGAIKALADYAIKIQWPNAMNIKKKNNQYIELFKVITKSQAKLIAQWMNVGFVHGVMNTDNMAISGQTIDYGPCAFIDDYNHQKVFSSIDYHGRYAYCNQAKIGQWNLAVLGGCFLPLLDDHMDGKNILQDIINDFPRLFHRYLWKTRRAKCGLRHHERNDKKLIQDLLNLMEKHHLDYTLTFRQLADFVEVKNEPAQKTHLRNVFKDYFKQDSTALDWLDQWQQRLQKEKFFSSDISQYMNTHNPAIIARNHLVEKAITDIHHHGDDDFMHAFVQALKDPYNIQKEYLHYMNPPKPEQQVHQTFCGT